MLELNQLTIADLVEGEVKEELAKKAVAFSVLATDFKEALTRIRDSVARRSTLPILSNVLLEPDQEHGLLRLSATNLEYAISTRIIADVECMGAGTGAITLPFADLVSEVASAPKKDKTHRLRFQGNADNLNVTITNGNATRTLQGMDASEYPTIPFAHGEEAPAPFVLTADQFKQAIALTTFAAAYDESRPVFTGILMQPENQGTKLTLVAADAFRMAVYEINELYPLVPDPGFIVPAITLNALAKLLPNRTTDVLVSYVDKTHQVVFLIPDTDTLLVSRLIDAQFPNFRTIIPKTVEAQVEVVLKPLAQACRDLKPLAKDSSNILRLDVISCGQHPDIPDEGEDTFCLQLSAKSETAGEKMITLRRADVHYVVLHLSEYEMNKRKYPPTTVLQTTFNVQYLVDVFDRLEKQGVREVTLHLQQFKPTRIVPVGYLEAAYQAIIMPMHVNR